jgi:hypothetical protein
MPRGQRQRRREQIGRDLVVCVSDGNAAGHWKGILTMNTASEMSKANAQLCLRLEKMIKLTIWTLLMEHP